MKICYQLPTRFRFWISLCFTLILLSIFFPSLLVAAKPTDKPTNPGLALGAVVKSNGNRTSITGRPHLTYPSNRQPREIALGFVQEHKEVFGLSEEHLRQIVVKKSQTSKHNGASHVYLEQKINGHRVSGKGLTVNIDAKGRIVSVGGPLSKGQPTGVEFITGSEAVRSAGQTVGVSIPTTLNTLASKDAQFRWENNFAKVSFPNAVTAELVWLEISPEELRLVWEVDFEVDGRHWFQSFVDAATGELLEQHNRYLETGPEGTVFSGQHPEDSSPRATEVFSGIGGTWVTDRWSLGNNVVAYRDLPDDDDGSSVNVVETPAFGDPEYQHFNYPWTDAWRTSADASDASLNADLNAVITQLFYYTNDIHDWLYGYGFDEASGNFQANNFGNGGADGDPVKAEAQDGWDFGCEVDNIPDDGDDSNNIRCRNNANFGTPADGGSPRMQMFMWSPSRPYRDGSMDGDVIAHEYGHGVSNRLVGGGTLGNAMVNRSLGEGWSDVISFLKWEDIPELSLVK
jgi:hypothetical protein